METRDQDQIETDSQGGLMLATSYNALKYLLLGDKMEKVEPQIWFGGLSWKKANK